MIFDQLPHTEQMALFTAAANEALGRWNIPYAHLETLGTRSNAVFAVSLPQVSSIWRFVLRVNWPGRKPFGLIRSELLWMDTLYRQGLPTPEVIYMPRTVSPDGQTAMICTLLSYLDGEPVSALDYTPAHAAAVGRMTAQMHGAAHHFSVSDKFQRPRLDFEGLFGTNSPYYADPAGEALLAPHRTVLDAVTARVADVFALFEALGDQYGLIHADLKPDNLLFAAPDAPRVLDFDDCGWGYYPYDLAPLLLFLRPNPAYADLKTALWAGYTALRPLPETVLDGLETLVAGRYVASCRWVAAHRDHPAYRGKVETILAARTAELAAFLQTGVLPR